jgi:hypothetical protein
MKMDSIAMLVGDTNRLIGNVITECCKMLLEQL